MTEGKRVRRGPFRTGEDILLISPKGEEHLITLTPGKAFGTHKGNLPHDDLIGKEDGGRAWTAMGSEYRAFRPTYMQFIMNQKRHAQIIYPKDTGTILMWADIFPGATVVEAGIGWGALTIKLLEAVGPTGKVISYEIREDFAESGAGTVRRYLGACENHEVKLRDIYLGIDEREVDRIVLDLPEPWQAVPHVREALGWSAVWIALGLSFAVFVYYGYENRWFGLGGSVDSADGTQNDGRSAAIKYLTGYVVEKSLSVDNIFVIAMIFGFFAVPAVYQHRVLFWGIWEEANKRLGAEKPDLEKEIARIEGQMASAQWAIDRYFEAFEAGTLKAELCN